MNPLCNYFGYIFLNYCLTNTPGEPQTAPSHIESVTNPKTEYEWEYINFTWPSLSTYRTAIYKKVYIPDNVAISAIRHYKGKVYVAMPQARRGVPATLGMIAPNNDTSGKVNSLITPFPNWEMNLKRECNALQSVKTMEVDGDGIMWIVDGFRANNITKCPPKLVLIDLNSPGRLLVSHIFPKEICLGQGGALSSIAVDDTDGGFAYIADNNPVDPGVIVYSKKKNRSWKLRDSSMFAEKDAANFTVNGRTFHDLSPISGVALSPPHSKTGKKLLFYSAMAGLHLYSVKTSVLKNEELAKTGEWRRAITKIGKLQGQSDALFIDKAGNLYYAPLPLNAVAKWNINAPFESGKIIFRDSSVINWSGSFSADEEGNLWLLTGTMDKFLDSSQKLQATTDVVQFRIVKL